MKLLACALAAVLLQSQATAEPLRLVSANWPPFTGQNLPSNGLDGELVSTALGRAGYTSTFSEVPWAQVIPGIQHDKYDAVVVAWSTPEREAFGHFSAPYQYNRMTLLRNKGSTIAFNQLQDIYPFTIGVERGASYGQAFDSDPHLHKVELNNIDSRARMLLTGRIQLIIEDQLAFQYQLNNDLRDIREQFEFLPKPVIVQETRLLVRRSHPQHEEIIQRFNEAIEAMRANGSYQEILQRHIPGATP
ncbi:MAG: transporter substrate-binding domain-containing protein [Pseudomonadaceae bacterium]|nr:transporter substrate-binding domain-containing protein [Pseudomonadaceae bacterium]